jgi:tRNA pseudouridine38-40 synthase
LDLERLKSAAALLIGTHDFAAFGSPTQKGGTTVRRVFLADWHERGDELSFEVTANAFLYRMVRRMVYLCVRVGQGELELTNLKRGLLEQVPLKPGMAPPQGLTLVEVAYPPLQENDLTIYAESSKETLAVSGDDDSGQDIRP